MYKQLRAAWEENLRQSATQIDEGLSWPEVQQFGVPPALQHAPLHQVPPPKAVDALLHPRHRNSSLSGPCTTNSPTTPVPPSVPSTLYILHLCSGAHVLAWGGCTHTNKTQSQTEPQPAPDSPQARQDTRQTGPRQAPHKAQTGPQQAHNKPRGRLISVTQNRPNKQYGVLFAFFRQDFFSNIKFFSNAKFSKFFYIFKSARLQDLLTLI